MPFHDEQGIKSSRILVVDDEPINLMVLTELLKTDGYKDITSLTNALDAVKSYQQDHFDLILLDILMPEMDGFEVMHQFSETYKQQHPPVMVFTSLSDNKTRNRALKEGARDFLVKPFDNEEILSRVYNLLEMNQSQKVMLNYNLNLEKVVKKRTQDLIDTQLEIVQRLGYAAEYRDTDTAKHTTRVGEYARILGEQLGLTGETLQNLHHAAPMHDIGKIGISDAILLKPGIYTPEERSNMEQHTIIGSEILKGGTSDLLITAKEIAISHHERWDGKGYPNGLKGTEIPLSGRITIVADVFDALTMSRPYKDAWTTQDAVKYIEDNSGKMFDPQIVLIFMKMLKEMIEIKTRYLD